MKRIILIVGGVLILLLIAAAVVPFLIPSEVYRGQIERAATNALGRDVALEGDVSISLFPQVSARVEGVTVANPEGFSRANMIEAGELRGVVKWGPLLSRRVEVAELAFIDADVMLERRADGTTNWEFGAGAPAEPPAEPGSSGGFDAGIDRARLVNARLVYEDAQAETRYELSELDMTATVQALDAPLSLEAEGLFQQRPFSLDLDLTTPQSILDGAPAQLQAAIGVEGGDASYDGTLTLGEAPALDGAFTFDGRGLADLAALAGVDVPYNLAALGSVDAAGTVSGPLDRLSVAFTRARLNGEGLEASYEGSVSIGEAIGLGGRFTMESGDLPAWLDAFGMEIPDAVRVLEDVSVAADLSGTLEALQLGNIALRQSGDLIDARFDGQVSTGGEGRISGRASASSNRLRPLLDQVGVELAPGETLQRFSLESDITGSFASLQFGDLTANLDEVRASGAAGLDLTGATPRVTGELVTGELDLSPFLTASESDARQPASTGWSDEPLDLAGLRAVNADLTLRADRIILGNITLSQPDLAARLNSGRFTATVASMNLFGGNWAGTLGLDASGDVPGLDLNFTGQTIEVENALMSLAGLNALSGLGELRVDVSSRGSSVKALVEGLNGEMGTNLNNGALRGINVGQIVRSRENIVQALADGTLQLALQPEAETDFTSLIAGLDISDGVANLSQFRLVNPVLSLEGSGSVNLGARTLDVSIIPRLDTTGQAQGSSVQLNNVPIPFRISGDWLSPSLSPDLQMVQNILAQDLTNRAADELRDELGPEAGAILDGLLGRRPAAPAPEPEPTPEPDPDAPPPAEDEAAPEGETPTGPEAEEEPQSAEDIAEDLARDALRDLFGNPR